MTGEATDATRTWQGIEASDPPADRLRFRRLLKMAEAMLAARRNGFPDQIAAGTMNAEDAAAELTLFEHLVADWRFIASGGAGEPAPFATIPDRRDALDASLRTIADIAREAGGFSETLGAKAQAVIALRWHLEPGRDTVALARLTHRLRADAWTRIEREPAQ